QGETERGVGVGRPDEARAAQELLEGAGRRPAPGVPRQQGGVGGGGGREQERKGGSHRPGHEVMRDSIGSRLNTVVVAPPPPLRGGTSPRAGRRLKRSPWRLSRAAREKPGAGGLRARSPRHGPPPARGGRTSPP